MSSTRHALIRTLFDNYIEMYAARDARLVAHFSQNFSGYTGGGDFLVSERHAWVAITEQDFAQVPNRLNIEPLDLLLQDLSPEVVLATALFHIRLPGLGMSRESARLTLIFRQEDADWKIVHSGISIPDQLVRVGEVYPIEGLYERNLALEKQLEERTRALEEASKKLAAFTHWGNQVRQVLALRLHEDCNLDTVARALNLSGRTLERRLDQESTSFQQLKDQLRKALALRLLEDGQLSAEDIAAAVGFSSLTAFHRAFKSWTGSTPRVFRSLGERRIGERRLTPR